MKTNHIFVFKQVPSMERNSHYSQMEPSGTLVSKITTKDISTINDVLPTEILKKILERLDIKSLCLARQTCKRWKTIVDRFELVEEASSKK